MVSLSPLPSHYPALKTSLSAAGGRKKICHVYGAFLGRPLSYLQRIVLTTLNRSLNLPFVLWRAGATLLAERCGNLPDGRRPCLVGVAVLVRLFASSIADGIDLLISASSLIGILQYAQLGLVGSGFCGELSVFY
jgi:hypothetical protein